MEVHVLTGTVEREVRAGTSKNNKPYTSFTIVTRRSWADKTFTSYHNCIAYGDTAKVAAGIRPGDIVQALANEVKAEVYVPKSGGDPKGSVNYTLREVEILSTGSAPAAKREEAPKPAASKPAPGPDEDVPF